MAKREALLQKLDVINAFQGVLKKAKAERLHDKPPKHLYHYTDVGGLIGILQKDCLWATNALYCNDASESSYALQVLDDAIDAALKKTESESAHALLKPLKGQWVAKEFAAYVACFCEDGNLLNQWRVYAPEQGYSVQFEAAKLLVGQEKLHTRHRFSLMMVIYSEKRQHALLGEILDMAVKYAEKHFSGPDEVEMCSKSLRVYLYHPIVRLLYAFKHPAFKDEKEWRLVCAESGTRGDAKYRPGRYGLTPYIEYCVPVEREKPREKLPIVEILHGPKANRETAGHAVYGLLASCGYNDVKVGGTLLPIR